MAEDQNQPIQAPGEGPEQDTETLRYKLREALFPEFRRDFPRDYERSSELVDTLLTKSIGRIETLMEYHKANNEKDPLALAVKNIKEVYLITRSRQPSLAKRIEEFGFLLENKPLTILKIIEIDRVRRGDIALINPAEARKYLPDLTAAKSPEDITREGNKILRISHEYFVETNPMFIPAMIMRHAHVNSVDPNHLIRIQHELTREIRPFFDGTCFPLEDYLTSLRVPNAREVSKKILAEYYQASIGQKPKWLEA